MTTCWCGLEYVRGVCPLHGVMRDPTGQQGGTTYVTENVAELPLTYASNALAANVTLTASTPTFYDGPSVSLSAGLWLVTFHATFSRSTTTAVSYFARITDKTTHYASGQQYHASVANHFVQMCMSAVIRLTTATTLYGQGATSAGSSGSYMRYALATVAYGTNATQITAVKIG